MSASRSSWLASSRVIAAMLASAALAAGSASCGFVRSLAGVNTVNLEKADVKSMSVDIRRDQKTICPRQPVQMAVFMDVVLEGDAQPKSFETWQGRGGVNKNDKLDFADFAFHSPQGQFDNDGWFTPNRDLLATAGTEFELTTAYRRRPDKFTFKLDFKPDYQCIDGSGRQGDSGSAGTSGTPGKNGERGGDGSENTAGGSGSEGTAGGSGGNGSDGAPGPSLQVYVTMVKTPFYDRLAALKIVGAVDDFLLFPPEQKVTIVARGGAGGNGGNGGGGGRGGDGGSGNPGGNGGRGGAGGLGGSGGNGGPGGSITLTFDPHFPALANAVHLDVSGGPAGAPGTPGPGGSGGSGGSGRGNGTMGASGSSGQSGAAGAGGRDGPNGSASAHPGNVADQLNGLPSITILES